MPDSSRDEALKKAEEIIDMLIGRASFDNWWYDIDEVWRKDILDEMAEIITAQPK